METTSSMKKCDAPALTTPSSDLWQGIEFPVESGFVSVLPTAALDDVHRACEEMRPTAMSSTDFLKERRARVMDVEFVM